VTTGDALRANKDMETDHGTPREYMEAGDLVPDPVVNEIVKAALEEADGYVLDGYPRNLSQAEYLDDITSLDTIAHLDVDEDVCCAGSRDVGSVKSVARIITPNSNRRQNPAYVTAVAARYSSVMTTQRKSPPTGWASSEKTRNR
jgi:Adenylate kinase and related kinases